MSTLPPLVLTETERAELQRRVRAHTTAQRDVTRARIVLLAADGATNRQIAARLSLSPETIKTHVRNVLFKFGVNSKAELRHILANWDFSGWM